MKRLTYWCDDEQGGGEWRVNVNGGETTGPHVDRLAAIEDILGDEYDLDKLMELVQAKRKGRCIVLPCQPGDRIWIDGRKAIIEEFFGYKTERYFHAQFYDNMQYIDVPFEEIGKTVFLTREEAEAALRREQDG